MSTIARLKITLQDVEPKVLRQIEVPVDLRLDRLHQVLEAALSWINSHPHDFRAGWNSWRMSSMGGPFDSGVHAEKGAMLQDMLDPGGGKTFRYVYVYDFGDD